jgi:dTDP-4-dehydrorhamnose 3,5-epimerase-like enzyme
LRIRNSSCQTSIGCVPQQSDVNHAQKGDAAFVKMFLVFQQATSLIAYCYEIVSYSVIFSYKNILKALHYIFRQEYKLGRLHQRR